MLLLDAPQVQVIAGENAVEISQLPKVWQDVANKEASFGLQNAHSYVEMAQLFQYKLTQGDVDLFKDRPELAHLLPSFNELFGQLARETLLFYGQDFKAESYPNFEEVLRQFESKGSEYANEVKVARIGIELFNEFGYELPASFYQVHLAPIYRDHVFEERALRFDPRDREHKRSWDAALHACKVFAVQMKIQSIASKYGFTYQHGCGCESHLSSIDESSGAFEYELHPQKRQRWIRSFIWTTWYEYAFFGIVPNTRYLV
ncbi:hypothetical protein G7B40_018340 [Aetokthonos hydrillicola Thurmond2011]|jgi:hypothetical protein|uniref:Uncharacterized protein n=1 Tax=Aetokthonos hydrillicola Thurmond2011 TaxID=2712845 RepID=A0AAP5I882_9CYAN|nr:hypothetical protein [Aetokthonos hydrillicola]MBO3461036.1 hypothetical protein [Aetokthonos hydrillicola CCALA 1050]MBW4588394.1 hypothetical protein [Aetokthonos hydrillicola CCALA 1050]MDR9896504.1 hypothetical protein [Aetokthonos hydrillicola Thurmond2011]